MTIQNGLGTATAIALGLTLLGNGAHAEEQVTLLDEVIIGYTEDGTPITAGDNTTMLDEEDLEVQGGGEKLDNVLRSQPSTFTRVNEGNPGVAVNIRGFEGSGRVAMSIDGIPQNFRWTGHEAQGFAFVDENFLTGIDITRGTQVTAGGTGIAGSVNFRTIDTQDLVEQGGGFGGKATLTYGSNADSYSGMVAAAHSGEKLDLMFAASRRSADEYEDPLGNVANNLGNVVNYSGQDVTSYLAKTGFRIDDRQSLKFTAIHYEANFSANSYESDLTNDSLTANYKFMGDSPWLNLDANVYWNKNEMEYVDTLTGTGSYVGRTQSTETIGFNATNISEFGIGAWSATSINGVDLSRDDLGGVMGNVNPTEGQTTRFSVFSENVFSNGPWEITAGARFNSYKSEGVSYDSTAIDVDHSAVDPKLTVAYQLTSWLQPYVSASRATRIPTLQETLLGGSHGDSSGGMFVPNPDLRPEVSTAFEIGANIEANDVFSTGDRLSGRINVYRMNIEDYIAGYFAMGSGGFEAGFANIAGTSVTEGLEVELKYATQSFDVALAYTRSNDNLPDQLSGLGSLQKIPEDMVSLSYAQRLLDGKVLAGAQYNWVSPEGSDDYGLLDVFVNVDVNETFSVTGKITNLTDEVYTPWMSTTGANGRGRSIYIGGEARF